MKFLKKGNVINCTYKNKTQIFPDTEAGWHSAILWMKEICNSQSSFK